MSIYKNSLKSISECIIPNHFQTTEPMLILGEPGIGQTAIVLQSIRELLEEAYTPNNVEQFYTVIDGSRVQYESLVVPYIDNKSVYPLQQALIPELKKAKAFFDDKENNGKKFIIIIDELSSLAQDEQRMMMKIIQSGLLPDVTLLDNDRLLVVSIGNASLLIPELKSYFLI